MSPVHDGIGDSGALAPLAAALLLTMPSCDGGPAAPVLEPDPGTFQAELRGPDGTFRVAGLSFFNSPSRLHSEQGVYIPRAAGIRLTGRRSDEGSFTALLFFGLPDDDDLPREGTYTRDKPFAFDDPRFYDPPERPGEIAAFLTGNDGDGRPVVPGYEVLRVEARLDEVRVDRIEGEVTLTFRTHGDEEGDTYTGFAAFSWIDCPTPKPCVGEAR